MSNLDDLNNEFIPINIDDVKSELRLIDLYFNSINFNLKQHKKFNIKNIKFDFQRTINKLTDKQHEICLILNILNEFDEEIIKIELVGIFELDIDDLEFANIIIKKNTIAILFPYIRSQLSILTCQPGFTPIILPPLNINNLIKD